MAKRTVLVCDPDAGRYVETLAARFPDLGFIAVNTPGELTGYDLAAVEVLIAHGGPVRNGIIDCLDGLRWAQSLGAGVDAFLDALAGRQDVLLTSTRGIHATQMAEMALTQMLVLSRDVARVVNNQATRTWQRWAPSLLRGKTVGIVGMGMSGREIATRCAAFGMRVLGVSRSATADAPFERVYRYHELATVAATVDYLLIVCALNADTQKLINSTVLNAMKRSAFLITLSRGGITDERALYDALVQGNIRGAAVDVFEEEPLPADNPLWTLPNAFLTPHLGGLSEDYVDKALEVIIPNLHHYLGGSAPTKMINLVPRTQ